MKQTLFVLATTLVGTFAMAQTHVEQGNVIVDPYIGLPNWANSISYNNLDDENKSWQNYQLNGGLLSYGGRAEYLLSDNFGIGVDINYEVSGYNYDRADSVLNFGTGMYEPGSVYHYDYKAKKLRVMARFNYHFVQNERLDAYTGFAGGYKYVNRTWESNKPNFKDENLDGALIPVTFRIAIGARVYFTDNIGAHVELGAFGGGLLQFGISAKF